MKTGVKIKQLRLNMKMSQEELAEIIGVSQVTISKWEQGKSIKHEFLPKLAETFNISADYLLKDTTMITKPSGIKIEKHQLKNDDCKEKYIKKLEFLLKEISLQN